MRSMAQSDKKSAKTRKSGTRKKNAPKPGKNAPLTARDKRAKKRSTLQKPAPRKSEQGTTQTVGNSEMVLQYGKNWLYGRHAVAATLKNPARVIKSILATRQAADWLLDRGLHDILVTYQIIQVSLQELDDLLPPGCVHQGVAIEASPLPAVALEDIVSDEHKGPILVLDQITDPQNIGAIFRSAAAFGARAIIFQERRTPALSGALAKAAVGAVEIVPAVPVVNIARTLASLQDAGFFCVGLAGDSRDSLKTCNPGAKAALVLGAEGTGLRPLVAKNCDQLVHIPIHDDVESLNVSVAAAISLYALKTSNNKI